MPDIEFRTQGPVGLIKLNRPKALNALSFEMIIALDRQMAAWETAPEIACVIIESESARAFCAGGDVRALYKSGGPPVGREPAQGELCRTFFFAEYRLNRRIHDFSKPYIALIDGVTMGGGVGVSVHGSYRVATENTLLAMPETKIGLFPDVGTTYFLARMPEQIGMYLGMTGAKLNADECLALQFATHATDSAHLRNLITTLTEADWHFDPTHDREVAAACLAHLPPLTRQAVKQQTPSILTHKALIARWFAEDSVAAIMDNIAAEREPFAAITLKEIAKASPTSLCLTHEALRRAKYLDFCACLQTEFRLIQACVTHHDFREGIRAVLIDKDHAPKWSPDQLTNIDLTLLHKIFDQKPQAGDLHFDPEP